MSMFDNYVNIDYIPDNTTPLKTNIFINEIDELPYKLYNINNKLIGLGWNEGDKFTLNVSVDKTIYVENDALILLEKGALPPTSEANKIGRKAYNINESLSWTCKCDDNELNWVKDKYFKYPIKGTVPYTFTLDMDNKFLYAEIVSFRQDLIKSFCSENIPNCYLEIDPEDFFLREGIYYLNLYIEFNGVKQLIDSKLLGIGNYGIINNKQLVIDKKCIQDIDLKNPERYNIYYTGGTR